MKTLVLLLLLVGAPSFAASELDKPVSIPTGSLVAAEWTVFLLVKRPKEGLLSSGDLAYASYEVKGPNDSAIVIHVLGKTNDRAVARRVVDEVPVATLIGLTAENRKLAVNPQAVEVVYEHEKHEVLRKRQGQYISN